MATFTPRALVFGDSEQAVYFRILKDFLFKLGLRETAFITDPAEISRHLFDNFWPIVFVDHSDGSTDAFAHFERVYKQPGYELVPFIFVVTEEKVVYRLFGASAGARGVIQKPLQPHDAAKLVKALIPPPGDAATSLALQVSRLLIKGETKKAIPALSKLAKVPAFKRAAEVALVRSEIREGLMAQAHQRLLRLLQADDKDVRILCEYADYFRRNAQYKLALAIHMRIRALHPHLNVKVWEQIVLHLELDQLDDAALLLDELQGDPTFRDLSTEGLARIMFQMGLTQSVANVLRPQPDLYKKYLLHTQTINQSRG